MTTTRWRFAVRLTSPETLRQFLRFRSMSYREVARKAGCSYALISHLVNGHRTHTGVDIAKGIAKALDVPVEALFLPEPSTAYANRKRGAA